MVPASVMKYPDFRKAYRERLTKLRPLFDEKNTAAIIDRAMARLGPAPRPRVATTWNGTTWNWAGR